MFDNIIDIHQSLHSDPSIVNIICFASPHLFSTNEIDKLKKKLNLTTIPYKLAKYLNWDLIIFPDHGPSFRKSSLKIYVNHGIFTGVAFKDEYYEFSAGARNQKNEIIYDKMFVSSDYLEQELQKTLPELNGKIKSVGNILVDEIINSVDNRNCDYIKLNFNSNMQTLMLVSTWGENSLIQSQGEELLDKVVSLSNDYNIIFSLHLNCYRAEHSENKNWLELIQRCKRPNVYLVPPGDKVFYLFQYVDLYIADRTSLSLYFSVLQKPMVIYNNNNLKLNKLSLLKTIREVVPLLDDINSLSKESVESYIANFNEHSLSMLSEIICSHKGESLKQHTIEIYDILNISSNHINKNSN